MKDKLIIIKGSSASDVSELVSTVKWSGRKGAAARTLSVTFIDDGGYGHDRAGVDVEEGHRCIYYRDGAELFRGMFMRQSQSGRKSMAAVAYDMAISLANNRDTFNYSGKTASEVFIDVCKRFGIPCDEGGVADTGYRIPELPKPKATGWDAICDALSLTHKATGVRYYPKCGGGTMRLLERRRNIFQWVVETGVNLEDYTLTKSTENVRSRIKLLSKEGAVLAEAADRGLEQKLGIFQDIESVNDEMNTGQLNEFVQSVLEGRKKPDRALTVSALGITDVITGAGVFAAIKELGISATFYVEEDTHTFQGQYHNMSLKLVWASDAEV